MCLNPTDTINISKVINKTQIVIIIILGSSLTTHRNINFYDDVTVIFYSNFYTNGTIIVVYNHYNFCPTSSTLYVWKVTCFCAYILLSKFF